MATLAGRSSFVARDSKFFFIMSIVMALIMVAGFSLQAAAGRSSFSAPFYVHIHALVFFGWVAIYVAQNGLAAGGHLALHRRLGWIAAGWVGLMLVMGMIVTIALVRRGGVPFFFTPLHFLIMDPVTLLTFAGLTGAAIRARRNSGWHRRLHYVGMSILLGPGIGRLLPMPFIPYPQYVLLAVLLLFPLIGAIADLRRDGRVHPAWIWGIGTMLAMQLVIDALTYSPIGLALYAAVTAGSPGAAVAPLVLPPPPPLP